MTEWVNNYTTITTGSTATGYLTTSGTYMLPMTFTSAPQALSPAPETPLAWLDHEIEKTCALAR